MRVMPSLTNATLKLMSNPKRLSASRRCVNSCFLCTGAADDFRLHAWVVMPSYVHLLITPQVEVAALLRRLKGASARESNKLLGRTGQPFWQDESYDRLVRSANEFQRIENYILQNPVRAGLARSAGRAEARRRLKPG